MSDTNYARELFAQLGVVNPPKPRELVLVGLLEAFVEKVMTWTQTTPIDLAEAARLTSLLKDIRFRGESVARECALARIKQGKETIRLSKVAQAGVFEENLALLVSLLQRAGDRDPDEARKAVANEAKKVARVSAKIRVALDLEPLKPSIATAIPTKKPGRVATTKKPKKR